MLAEFINKNRFELLQLCHASAANRNEGRIYLATLGLSIPAFLSQLVDALLLEEKGIAPASASPLRSKSGRTAVDHGAELLSLGCSVEQVVHEYGDVCQAVTGLAVEMNEQISNREFRTLNRCLDDAIADAVTPFVRAGPQYVIEQAVTLMGIIDAFGTEQARLLATATHAFSAIRTGGVATGGPTGQLMMHVLDEIQNHLDRALPALRAALDSLANQPAAGPAVPPPHALLDSAQT